MGELKRKLAFIVTEDWYFCSHRLLLARAARDAGYEVVVITRTGDEAERIRAEGFRLYPLDMRRGAFHPGQDIRTLFCIVNILRKERPTIVHNVALKPVILGTIAARLTSVPAIVNAVVGLGYAFTSQDSMAATLRRLSEFVFRYLLRSRVIAVIVQNVEDRTVIGSFGVPSDQIVLIAGSGVDPLHFKPTPEPSGPVIVAMVSRMLRDKGVVELVEAARLIRAQEPEIKICLVGSPDAANPSSIDEATLDEWVHEGLVEWLGPVRDVRSVWEMAHIAVLPSYREGLPKSLLEAAASGRPLVATDVPGCRDIVVHEETGLLIPPRDSVALAEAILRLVRDPVLRIKLGGEARTLILKQFTVEHVVEQTLSVYSSMQ